MQTNPYLTPGERTRLAAATVGIAGAGGLGSNCALHLVRSGVGRLVIADFDVVNDSNLNRQFYFRDQIGRKKVEALRENLLRIDPEADIVALDTKIDVANAKDVFAPCGIVVEAFDRADAKSMLLGALAGSGKQLVAASGIAGWGRSNAIRLRRFGGEMVVIGDGESAVSDEMPPFSPRVGIAAAMQANTVVAMLLGREL